MGVLTETLSDERTSNIIPRFQR